MAAGAVLLVLTLALLVAAPARASTYPGGRPVDGQVWAEIQVAVEFWRARGVTGAPGCEAVIPYVEWLPRGVIEWTGWIGSCEVHLNRRLVRQARRRPFRRYKMAFECALVVRAVGFAYGWAPRPEDAHWDGIHAVTGVMAPYLLDENIPWDCTTWARTITQGLARRAER